MRKTTTIIEEYNDGKLIKKTTTVEENNDDNNYSHPNYFPPLTIKSPSIKPSWIYNDGVGTSQLGDLHDLRNLAKQSII